MSYFIVCSHLTAFLASSSIIGGQPISESPFRIIEAKNTTTINQLKYRSRPYIREILHTITVHVILQYGVQVEVYVYTNIFYDTKYRK